MRHRYTGTYAAGIGCTMRRFAIGWFLACVFGLKAHAQSWSPPWYDTGSPVWQEVWVNPVQGSDANNGTTSNTALRSVSAAWNRIPRDAVLTNHGFRIRLVPGLHTNVPTYWEERRGTPSCPIWFEAMGTNGSVILPDLNIFDCSHLYFTGIQFNKTVAGGDGFHVERGRHLLLRDCTIRGNGLVQEGIKVNQSRHIYLERCDISGAGDNAVDFVAVQGGHIRGCRIHDAGDWALYVKGGSAGILIDGNEVFDAGTGGITAGQGTGFEFMTAPWLHYETYDIKIVNNFIHDTSGAGLGVNGGYNILLAHNTLVRVGAISHVMEFVHGRRGCDGDTATCSSNQAAGGWGTSGAEFQYIPNRHVYVFNNIVYNPAPFQSQWQQFAIHGPVSPPVGSNLSGPQRADEDLLIRGNVIWNGPVDHPVLGDSGGCQTPPCTEALLLAENQINTVRPQFIDEAAGDYRPAITGNLHRVMAFVIPPFPGGDAPATPVVPAGEIANDVPRERTGYPRYGQSAPPGAWTAGASVRLTGLTAASADLAAESGFRYRIETASYPGPWTAFTTVQVSQATQPVAMPPGTAAVRLVRAVLVP